MKHRNRHGSKLRKDGQYGRIGLRIGERIDLTVEATFSPQGLLAIGALVSRILLSTAVIVRVARRATGVETDR